MVGMSLITFYPVLWWFSRLLAAALLFCLMLNPRVVAMEQTVALDEAQWTVTTQRFFSCRLMLKTASLGVISLRADAGAVREIRLDLLGYAPFQGGGLVSTVDAPWQHSGRQDLLSDIYRATDQGVAFDLGSLLPELLDNLFDGMWLNVEMTDPRQPVLLNLSTTGIRDVLPEFKRCLGDLLPVNFAQIRRTQLFYDSGKWQLTSGQMKRLRDIARYIQADKKVIALTIDGHTDATGDRLLNLRLSRQRAETVRDYLIEEGVPAAMVTHLRFHGQRYPTASNATKTGRHDNRRVMVALQRKEDWSDQVSNQGVSKGADDG